MTQAANPTSSRSLAAVAKHTVEAFLDAYRAGDLGSVAELTTADVVYRVPGQNAASGTFHGASGLGKLAATSPRTGTQILHQTTDLVVPSPEGAVVATYHTLTATLDDAPVVIEINLRFDLAKSRITHITEYSHHQHLTDEMFRAHPKPPVTAIGSAKGSNRRRRWWTRAATTMTLIGAAAGVGSALSADANNGGSTDDPPVNASAPAAPDSQVPRTSISTPTTVTAPAAPSSGSSVGQHENPPDAGHSTARRFTVGAAPSSDVSVGLEDAGTPVFPGDFADPFVLELDAAFIAYSTNTLNENVPVLRASANGVEALGDALPALPEWSTPGFVWAPTVLERDGTFVLYYTTLHAESGRMCIGLATSSSATGPFIDDSREPFICDLDSGGSIDASPFVDSNNAVWLLWKNDGNCCGIRTHIYVQPLTNAGRATAGPAIELIRDTESWEAGIVEGPTMLEAGGTYHLLYSANRWDSADYAIGHAVCETPVGPCVKDEEPWLTSDVGSAGPGGPETFTTPDGTAVLLAFHAWDDIAIGYETGSRSLHVTPLQVKGTNLVAPRLRR